MTTIKIMTWNIEQLSINKLRIDGMAEVIARTVVANEIDLLILVEVRSTDTDRIMSTLSTTLNAESGGGHHYQYWVVSEETGLEHYGYIIKDIDMIRPIELILQAGYPDGTSDEPLRSLRRNKWKTWPCNFGAAFPVPLPQRPEMPLIDRYAKETNRSRYLANFSGQAMATDQSYSQGRGYRLPALAMFKIHTPGGFDYVLPTICCHYAAVRGGKNHLGQEQVKQLKDLHICQLFNDRGTAYPKPTGIPHLAAHSQHIYLDGAAVAVQEILFTGDYNLDFLVNSDAVGATDIQKSNQSAYFALTPTMEREGSDNPLVTAVAPDINIDLAPAGSATPFTNGVAKDNAPTKDDIKEQQLKAAVTAQGTILHHFDLHNPPVPAPPPNETMGLRGAAFDNFIYGGVNLNGAERTLVGGVNDAGIVIDIPAKIVITGNAINQEDLDLFDISIHYCIKNTKNAQIADNLHIPGIPQLYLIDRLIGARFISDHLPVVMKFDCP